MHYLFPEATGKEKKNNNTKKTEKCGVMPAEIAAEPELAKYWAQRYRLFSRFDEGIKLDHGESRSKQNTHTFNLFIQAPAERVNHMEELPDLHIVVNIPLV